MHAIGAAHNLLSAMLDNHLSQGNALGLDPRRILWKRVIDMNDRALRNVVLGLGGPAHGVPREGGFEITVASEVMAILCLARDLADFKARVERIIVAETPTGDLVEARSLKAAGAMAVLMKDAIKPNLVQTLEGTPAFVHGGPFGNIAHGCNSLIATRLALKLGEIVVTEAGFASDLGAEKFVDIKARTGGLRPAAAVIVATVRALKLHGGVALAELGAENVEAVRRGSDNLAKHVENVRAFGLTPVVALNHFTGDTPAEVAAMLDVCRGWGVRAAVSRGWGPARPSWPRPCWTRWPPPTPARSTSSIRKTGRSSARSRRSSLGSTAATPWGSLHRRPPSSRAGRASATGDCPSAWRRPRTRCPTIRRSSGGRAPSR